MTEYASFRQRLDAALSTLDVQQVQEFLIAEEQWDEDTPADPEFAMWMMIAGSPTLQRLHEQARAWLVTHGHEQEAAMVLGKGRKSPGGATKKGQPPRPGQSRTSHTSADRNRPSNANKKRP